MALTPHIVRGVAWMVAVRWCMRGLDIVAMVILARLLAPDDFGVFANAILVVGVLEVMTQAGIDLALIRNENAERAHYNAAWTVQILQGIAVFLVLMLVAPSIADFFNEPRVLPVIYLLSLRPLIASFTNIGVVQFLKELDYRSEFYFGLYKKLTVVITTLILALILRNYMALVIGIVAGTVLSVIISYVMHSYRPRIAFEKVREIWSFSGWMLLYYGAEDLVEKTDRLVVAAIANSAQLGQYHMGWMISYMPSESVVVPLWKALTPIYAKLKDNSKELIHTYLNNLGFTALLSMAIGFGTAAIAEDLVTVIFGYKWIPAIHFVQWLALVPAMAGLIDSAMMIISVLGHTRLCAIHSCLRLCALVVVLPWVGLQWGVQQVAVAACIMAVLLLPLPFIFLLRLIPISAGQIIERIWRPIFSGIIMFAAIKGLHPFGIDTAVIRLVTEVLVGTTVYCIANIGLWVIVGRPAGVEQSALKYIGKKYRNRSNHPQQSG